MAERICPSCGRGILTRCGRKGLWEQYVLPLFGVFPWRCGRCRTRFRLSDRGAGFQRIPVKPDYFDEVVTSDPVQTPRAVDPEEAKVRPEEYAAVSEEARDAGPD